MTSVPEEPDRETIALIEKLRPVPERDPQAAANGKFKFLAKARTYAAEVSTKREQRHIGWKEDAMHLARIPVALFVILVIGLVVVGMAVRGGGVLMSRGSFGGIGNTFSTINNSLSGVGPRWTAAPLQATGGAQYYGAPTHPGLYYGAPTNPGLHLGQTPRPGIPTNPEPAASPAAPVPPNAGYTNQMVIKNGDIRLLVQDTDRALDGVTQTVTDVQGYVVSSRTWYQDYGDANYKYATLTIGVPVDQFENAERRLRGLAVRVLDDTASGEDVTNQYVDLQSQLNNLEATRDRIKSFLDQAQTVDEALQVNQQLSEVEAQIEQIKGQMNYLSTRAAFSTITINLEPELPELVPTPTPTATPTPVQGLGPWDAGKTARQATDTLASAYRVIADALIWLFVVLVPIVGPPIVLVWLAMWLMRRRSRAVAKEQEA